MFIKLAYTAIIMLRTGKISERYLLVKTIRMYNIMTRQRFIIILFIIVIGACEVYTLYHKEAEIEFSKIVYN